MNPKDYKITPLKGSEDYTIWSIRAKAGLSQIGLLHAISNDIGRTLTKEDNDKALGYIQLICSDAIIEQIEGYNSCKTAWKYLQNTFKPEGFTTEHILIKDFFNSQLSNFNSAEDYINTLKRLLSHLKAKEVTIEQMAMSWLLYSLTDEYQGFSQAIVQSLRKDPKAYTFETLCSSFLDESKGIAKKETVYTIKQGPKKASISKKGNFCSNCKKPSHNAKDCWFLFPNKAPSSWKNNSRIKKSTSFTPKKDKKDNKNQEALYTALAEAISSDESASEDTNNQLLISLDNQSLENQALENQTSFDEEMDDILSNYNEVNNLYNPSINITKREPDSIAISLENNESKFVIDSGATIDTISNKSLFYSYTPVEKTVKWGEAKTIAVKGVGNILLQDKITKKLKCIKGAYYVPELGINLISVRKLRNTITVFDENKVTILDKNTLQPISKGYNKEGLYYLPFQAITPKTSQKTTIPQVLRTEKRKNPIIQWHYRLGHIAIVPLIATLKRLKIKITKEDLFSFKSYNCESCILARNSTHIAKKSPNLARPYQVLERIHSDIGGPLPNTYDHYRYYITFIDKKTRYTEVSLLKTKSEAQEAFHSYRLRAERAIERPIKELFTDNGTEYINNRFEVYLKNLGIELLNTPPYTKEPNGLAERINRTLITKVRAILYASNMPIYLWGEALVAATYLYNRTPHKSLGLKTPFELYYGYPEYIQHLQTWGSIVYYSDNKPKSKLQAKTKKAVLIGYGSQNRHYKLYDFTRKRTIWSRDVTILENSFLNRKDKEDEGPQEPSISIEDNQENNQESLNYEDISNRITRPSRRSRSYIRPSLKTDLNNITSKASIPSYPDKNNDEEAIYDSITVNTDQVLSIQDTLIPEILSTLEENNYNKDTISGTIEEPNTFKEAMTSLYKQEWYSAGMKEIQEFENQRVYDIIDLPKGVKPIGGRWVYKIKHIIPELVKSDWITNKEKTIRFKARYVIQGYNQRLGIDYLETFSTTARSETWHMLLIVAINKGWIIQQYDVQNAFLHSKVDTTIYTKLPEGYYNDPKYAGKIAILRKALYGLKQAPRLWYKFLLNTLKSIGFKVCPYDEGVFLHPIEGYIIVCHVDDILIIHSEKAAIAKLATEITKSIKIDLIGDVSVFLGNEITINRDQKTITISQQRYTKKLLSKFEITKENGYKLYNLPGTPGIYLKKNSENATSKEINQFQQEIGSLLFLALKTRPDITYNVCLLARFMSNPSIYHFKELKKLWGYILNNPLKGLQYNCKGDLQLKGYTDSSWADDINNRKSTSGYLFSLGEIGINNPISWTSQLQKTIALSTCEAEYMALRDSIKEALYLGYIFNYLDKELNLGYSQQKPTILTDNEGAIKLSENPEFHKKTKHIDLAYHFNRDTITQGLVKLHWISTKEQIADILTKNIPYPQFKYLIDKVKLIEIS
jgi:hypothetical protein